MDLRPHRPPRTPFQRAVIFVGVMAFAGFGIFFFGGRMPVDTFLRFDLPPTIRGPGTSFPRAEVSRLDAELLDTTGQRAASVSIAIPDALHGPRTPAVSIRLKSGPYAVRARVTTSGSPTSVPMSGLAKIHDGEVVVELHTAQ